MKLRFTFLKKELQEELKSELADAVSDCGGNNGAVWSWTELLINKDFFIFFLRIKRNLNLVIKLWPAKRLSQNRQ